MRRRTSLVAAAAAALLLLGAGTSALAASKVDQSQSDTTGGSAGFCEESVGQTFVANVTGTLTHLAVAVNRSTIGDPGDLVFRVRAVDGEGLPAARILGSATAPNGSIAVGPPAWLQLAIQPTPRVTAGWWYAITTDAPGCDQPGDSGFGWAIGDGEAYARGTALYATGASGPWSRLEDRDHAFSTRVRPLSPVFQPDTMVAPKGGGAWVGADLYDWDGWTERIETSVAAGVPRTWLVRIQNDGTGTDSFRLRGNGSANGFAVTWLKGRTGTESVTARVVAGTYVVGPLRPGAARVVRVVITPRTGLASGEFKAELRATSLTRPRHVDGIHVFLTVE